MQTYSVATTASPAAGGTTSGDGTYDSGTEVTVVATANPGYVFENWTGNGVPVSALAGYSFAISANRDLVANFTSVSTTCGYHEPRNGNDCGVRNGYSRQFAEVVYG
ncbi:MAG: hypothetical protein HY706_12605 [Candidatus Hydrogenedentes bacterium]|nr:hypothetical protein [Candidatus Hydrogenedentota bacterium]